MDGHRQVKKGNPGNPVIYYLLIFFLFIIVFILYIFRSIKKEKLILQ